MSGLQGMAGEGKSIKEPLGGAAAAAHYDRAWLVLLGASLCLFCGQPGVAYYTYGVFVPEIIANTHWSGAAVAGAIGPAVMLTALSSPLLGTVTDRVGPRMVALLGGPAFAFGLVFLGLFPTSARTFAIAMMVMWLLAFGGSPVPYAHLLTGWFDKRRGIAISTMFGCGALSIAVWPPYAAILIAHFGWRHAYVVMGLTAGTVIYVATLLLLKNAPIYTPANAPLADSFVSPAGISLREALRTVRFWKLAVIFMLLTAVLAGSAVNLPVILRMQGADPRTAASVMSVVGVAMLLGRLSLALLLDRWFSPHITIAITIVPILAFCLMMFGASKLVLFAAAGCIGYGLGSEYAVAAYIVSRAFGFRAFGAIYGVMILATGIGSATGPSAIGVSLQDAISTRTVFAVAIALLLIAILVLLTLRKKDLPFGGIPAS